DAHVVAAGAIAFVEHGAILRGGGHRTEDETREAECPQVPGSKVPTFKVQAPQNREPGRNSGTLERWNLELGKCHIRGSYNTLVAPDRYRSPRWRASGPQLWMLPSGRDVTARCERR